MENLLFSLAREIRSVVPDPTDTRASKRAAQLIKEKLVKSAPDEDTIKKDVEKLVFDRAAEAKYIVSRLARYKQSLTCPRSLYQS